MSGSSIRPGILLGILAIRPCEASAWEKGVDCLGDGDGGGDCTWGDGGGDCTWKCFTRSCQETCDHEFKPAR